MDAMIEKKTITLELTKEEAAVLSTSAAVAVGVYLGEPDTVMHTMPDAEMAFGQLGPQGFDVLSRRLARQMQQAWPDTYEAVSYDRETGVTAKLNEEGGNEQRVA